MMVFISQSFMRIEWTTISSRVPRAVLGQSKHPMPSSCYKYCSLHTQWPLHKWPVTRLPYHFHSQVERGHKHGKNSRSILFTQTSIDLNSVFQKQTTLKKCEIFIFKSIQILVLSCRKKKNVNSNKPGASITSMRVIPKGWVVVAASTMCFNT